MKPHTPRQIVDMIKKQTKPRIWSKELRDWYVAEIIDLVRYNLSRSLPQELSIQSQLSGSGEKEN